MIFNRKILSLEAIRGIAALMVLFFHSSQGIGLFTQEETFNIFFDFGNKGVDLFFVLSGFIIFFVHYQDIDHRLRIKHYLWRRFSRIYPIYWIACSLALIFYALQGRVNGEEFGFQNILHSFLLFPFEIKRLLAVSWTLIYEVMFYFLFGLLILNRLLGQVIFIAWALIIISTQLIGIKFPVQWEHLFAPRNLEFLFGMLAAACVIHFQQKLPIAIACLGFCIFLGFAIGEAYSSLLKTHIEGLLSPFIYGLGGSLFMMGIVSHEIHQKIFIPPFLLYLGAASYSIYLIHVPALLFFFKMIGAFHIQNIFSEEALFMLSSVFALLIGILFYCIVEKPTRNFLVNFRKKHAVPLN